MSNNKNRKSVGGRMTWAHATRDMVIASMNKGQLPILVASAMILIILVRLKPEDLRVIVDRLIDLLLNFQLWSYILNIGLILAWYFHAKSSRKEFSKESARIGKEKSSLQNQKAGRQFKSSE